MKQYTAAALACLVVLPCLIVGPSGIAYARGLRYKAVSLDSLPLVQSDSGGANILTPGSPGHYRDMTINNGVQLSGNCYDNYNECLGHGVQLSGNCHGSVAEFNLQRKYDEFFGTIYDEFTDTGDTAHMTVYDASNPNQKHALYRMSLPGLGQVHFRIRVRGVTYVLLAQDTECNVSVHPPSNLDVVATLSIGSLPPTQVVSRFPTGNAGEPANSKVLFGWQPFPRAVNYAFHVWLISQNGSAAITKYTPVTYSTLVYHTTSYTWDDHGFLPGTYQYALLPLDARGKALAGWGTPVQITLAS